MKGALSLSGGPEVYRVAAHRLAPAAGRETPGFRRPRRELSSGGDPRGRIRVKLRRTPRSVIAGVSRGAFAYGSDLTGQIQVCGDRHILPAPTEWSPRRRVPSHEHR